MKAIVKVEMFGLPNFLRIEGMPDGQVIDIGHAFQRDSEAEEFWDDCRAKWLDHVRKRRESLTVTDVHQ